MSTKNKIKQMSEPTRRRSPKKSPLDAPTQSTRVVCAWAKATALRDNMTSNRCSRSSSVVDLKWAKQQIKFKSITLNEKKRNVLTFDRDQYDAT